MRHTSMLVGIALIAAACAPPQEADADLSSIFNELFAASTATDADVVTLIETFETTIADIDLEGAKSDRAFSINTLSEAQLADVSHPPFDEIDPSTQEPVAVLALSSHAIQDDIDLLTETNLVCLESDTSIAHNRTAVGDSEPADFIAGTTTTLDTDNEIRKENSAAKVWYTQDTLYRRFTLSDDRTAMLAWSSMPQVYPGDEETGEDESWDQLYGLEIFIENASDSDTTTRAYAFWSSVTAKAALGISVTGAVWTNAVEDGLFENIENRDAWVDGTPANDCDDRRTTGAALEFGDAT